MIIALNSFFQMLTITLGTFMIERYVLLEPPMEPKKQRIFYIIAFSTIITAYFIFGEAAQMIALIYGGLNILLGRKKHRIAGFFMTIPLVGIINGAAAPILLVPYLLRVDEHDPKAQAVTFAVYLLLMALLVIFFFKGREWRAWFGENMKDRKPRPVEYVLVFVAGIVIMMFSSRSKELGIEVSNTHPDTFDSICSLIVTYELTAFILTVALIVMIMQGNKNKFFHDKISAMQFSIIETMADIVENRDENTGGHIKRTGKYVEIIGRKLRSEGKFPETLTEEYLSDMIVAAPLHDIGKIHIPDSILNKPARLTEEEFEIMKTHTTAGKEVLLKAKSQLGEFDYLNIAVEMAEYHHEWWNGRGYPNGISEEDIPLCARIMAVADVFDALTAKRCYKAAMPVEKAYSIIQEETGTHFDPIVAEAFLASKDKIEEALGSEGAPDKE